VTHTLERWNVRSLLHRRHLQQPSALVWRKLQARTQQLQGFLTLYAANVLPAYYNSITFWNLSWECPPMAPHPDVDLILVYLPCPDLRGTQKTLVHVGTMGLKPQLGRCYERQRLRATGKLQTASLSVSVRCQDVHDRGRAVTRVKRQSAHLTST
jgi:hypothetical protein